MRADDRETIPRAWDDVPTDDPVEQASREFGRVLSGRSDEAIVISGDMSAPLADLPFSEGVANALWNTCETETVSELHRLLRDAGATAAVTNTLSCSEPAIAAAGLDVPMRDANERAVRAAYSSASRYVVGAIGPCGIDPAAGGTALRAARSAYRDQARRLKWGQVHALLVTRMRGLADALAAVEASSQVCDRPIVCCVECDSASLMPDGTRVVDAFRELATAGAHGLGACVPLAGAPDLAGELVASASASGCGAAFVLDVAGHPLRGKSLAAEFGRVAGLLRAAGSRVIGCGAGASVAHTAAVSDAVLAVDDRLGPDDGRLPR